MNPALIANVMRRKSKSFQLACCASCALFITLVSAGKGLSDYLISRPLELHGKPIVGTVIDVEYYTGKMRDHVPLITYKFTPPHGHVIQDEGYNWEPTKLGDKVDIRYIPDDPERNLLTNDLENKIDRRFGFIALTCLFGIPTVWLFGASLYYHRHPHKKT